MQFSTEKEGNTLIVLLDGRIDGTNAREFEEQILEQIGTGVDDVVIDFSHLNYISSAGLRAILVIAKDLKKRSSKLELCAISEHIHEVFKVSGFDQILSINDTRAKALAALSD